MTKDYFRMEEEREREPRSSYTKIIPCLYLIRVHVDRDVQWNLQIKDTLGEPLLSFVRKLPFLEVHNVLEL